MSAAKKKITRGKKPVRVAKPRVGKKVYCVMCPKWEIKRPERCSNTLARKGGTKYFCTAKCKERFLKSEAA